MPRQSSCAAGKLQAVVDRRSGELTYLGDGAFSALQQGPRLNSWRAATDNDGFKLLGEEYNPDRKALTRWRALGLPELKLHLERVEPIEMEDGSPGVEIVHTASGRGNWDDFRHTQRIAFLPTGELRVENEVAVGEELIDLPRVGVNLALAPGMEELTWFGRGPWENYADRKAAAMVGVYESMVADEYVPYIVPQEHGHKTDVRWLRLTDAQGRGLEVRGEPTLEFSASHFTDDDLWQARHTSDLQPRPEVILNLDAAQRGLGTASCGPDTLEQYKLQERVYRFAYRLKVV